jgi:hypothetical protein
MAGQKKTSKKQPSAKQNAYLQRASLNRQDPLAIRQAFSPSGQMYNDGVFGNTPDQMFRAEGGSGEIGRRQIDAYLDNKTRLRNSNIAIPALTPDMVSKLKTMSKRDRELWIQSLEAPNLNAAKLYPNASMEQLHKITTNRKRILSPSDAFGRKARFRGAPRTGPGLMGMAIAGGLGTLTKKILDNNRKEMQNR